VLSGLCSPKRKVFCLGEKVFSPKRGYSRLGEKAPGASVLSGVLSPRREILRSGEDIFTPKQEYFRLGENGQCSLDYFRSGEWYFRSGEICLAQAKKKKQFFFWLFVSECLALLECNVCIE